MVLSTWEKEVVLAPTTVSIQFADFVSERMKVANERYHYPTQNPREKLSRPEPVPESMREYNNKPCVLLLPTAPEEIKSRVLGGVDETRQISSLNVLDEIWHYVAPGGQEELRGLTKFVRDPGTTTAAEDALKIIRLWMQTRKRATMMGIPELSPHEQMQVMEKLTRDLKK